MIFIPNNDDKSNGKKKYIGVWVYDETKTRWRNIAQKYEISTIAKLIRKSIDFYDDSQQARAILNNIDSIVHELKEPLSSIKGFSQILIENYKDELSFEVLLKLKEIFDNSLILEQKISEHLEEYKKGDKQIDVLIIDDDLSTIKLLTDFFENNNYQVEGVINGTKAIESIRKIGPKLILLDIFLPDMSGYDVCKEIKSNKELKEIPIIYITAVPEIDVLRRIKETGANGYILKPFNILEFNSLFKYL